MRELHVLHLTPLQLTRLIPVVVYRAWKSDCEQCWAWAEVVTLATLRFLYEQAVEVLDRP